MISYKINGNTIRGLLIDLDGVLYIGSNPVGGAIEYMNKIADLKVPYRYITNTTRMSLDSLSRFLRKMSFPVEHDQIFSAPMAAKKYITKKNVRSLFLLTGGDVRSDFEDLPLSETSGDVVVMGDPGKDIDYDRLNRGFRILMNGAEFVAMQRNRYWRTEEGLVLDAGAFVAALEYASGKQATVVGKPSREFFSLAVESIGLPENEIAMIGDDIETDILGAHKAGLTTILVRTGKYNKEEVQKANIKPDLIINSFAELEKYEV